MWLRLKIIKQYLWRHQQHSLRLFGEGSARAVSLGAHLRRFISDERTMPGLSAQLRQRGWIFHRGNVCELRTGSADFGCHTTGLVVLDISNLAVSLGIVIGSWVVLAVCSGRVPLFSNHLDSPRPPHRPVSCRPGEAELNYVWRVIR